MFSVKSNSRIRAWASRAIILAVAALLLSVGATSAPGQSLPGYQAPDKPQDTTPVSVKAARGEAPLRKLYGHLKADSAKTKRLPTLDKREQKTHSEKLLEIGVVRALPDDLDPLTDSTWYPLVEGDVRVAEVVSEGALYTRVHFKGMSLAPGARVFVYSASNPDEYYGPYEGHGPSDDRAFWSPPMKGDAVVIEYFTPVGVKSDSSPFKVSAIAHIYKDVFGPNDPAGACNVEVTSPWIDVAKSVGMLQFVKNGSVALCTGALLNDSDTTKDHHVLTANHCISSQSEAESVTVYWNYNTGDTPPGGTPTTSGANLLATGIWGDFSLLRLTGALPGGLFFSGWDASSVSFGTSVTGLHHPQGSHKRISFGATNPDCDSQLPSSCSNFTGVTWSQGTTEAGSSGSGIWTGTPDNAKLVGTLTGGYAACDNLSGSDFYARFSAIYPSVAVFLEPKRTLTVASLNPNSGVGVLVTPNDINNQGGGSTQFTRTFNHGATVTLVASTPAGGNNFQKWLRDGVDFTTSASVNVTMDANHTMTAVYVSPPMFVLTVASVNPNNGVTITVTPNDNTGAGSGSTQFTRTYNQNTNVNLTASASISGNLFWKWQVDGVDFTTSQSFTVTMDAAHTVTAIYFTPTPTPTPTPVPGAGAQRIAFVKAGTSPNSGLDLFLTNVDGTNVVNITDAPGHDEVPAWSPDGSRLAYTCQRQPDGSISLPRRLCVRNADGTGFVVLSNTLTDDYGPAWSRDGSQIAFTSSNSSSSPAFLSVMNADGTGRFSLFFTGASNPDWSPDNWTLVFNQFGSIWTYNRLTQTSLRLTNGTNDLRPRYSPDGSKIVFESWRNGQPEIYVMNAGGSGQTRLTNNTAYDTAPAWSPDGTKILFTSLRDGDQALYVMNADGSNQTRVTAGSDGVWRAMSTLQFSQSNYNVSEGAGFAAITVTRTGDAFAPATVKYSTSDATDVNFRCDPATAGQITGAASRKCDYHIAVGRLRFAIGETSKTIILSIVDDVYVEGSESLNITLSDVTNSTLSAPSSATVNITDNDTPGQPNPIDGTRFYVRMLYVDLLSREPEPAGWDGWTHRIDFCGQPGEPPPPCDRVTVGGDGFLRSAEFFDREFFVIRLYRTALGRILRYDDVGDLAYVSGFLSSNDLELNKQELITEIMARPEFTNIYNGLSNAAYVDKLIENAGATLPNGLRDNWVNRLDFQLTSRFMVLRELSERPEVSAKYLHEAQVVSCYYGFFTRNPDAAYFNFLARLDSGEINLGDLANAFINAAEYRQRFGP